MLLIVLHKPAVTLESGEIIGGFPVNAGIVFVGTGIKVNFRLYDVVERSGIAFRLFSGFVGVKDIVGARCDLGDEIARRAHTSERFYFCHGIEIFSFYFLRTMVCLRSGPIDTIVMGVWS